MPGQGYLNVDETGHKQGGRRMWTWCFRAELYTLFKIDSRRSGDVLIETLGQGVQIDLGVDRRGAEAAVAEDVRDPLEARTGAVQAQGHGVTQDLGPRPALPARDLRQRPPDDAPDQCRADGYRRGRGESARKRVRAYRENVA